MSPVFPVFHAEETVKIGLKKELRVGTNIHSIIFMWEKKIGVRKFPDRSTNPLIVILFLINIFPF